MAYEIQQIMTHDEPSEPIKGNQKENLQSDISLIETSIKSAQADQDQQPTYSIVSPELANERHRKIVFLKKDLEKKKAEFKELN